MNYEQFQNFNSQSRANRFLHACNGSKTKARKLYHINIRVAQSFYPVLNLFEVILRNQIDIELKQYFNDIDWIIHEKNGFMNDNSLRPSRFFLKKSIEKAERIIVRRGGIVSSGKVIAEQTLGFWTSLFDTHHYRLIGGVVIQCFPNKPAQANRSLINQKLGRIREFRNRVYHNEPIFFNQSNIDFTIAENTRIEIFELLNWIDPIANRYVSQYDNVLAKTNMAINL